ncbi:DUF1653 domain-containing protein [Rickettsia koreansis]
MYKHYKEKLYKVIDTVKHKLCKSYMIISSFWVRPLEMFNEKVLLHGKNIPRFEFISEK